jgi:hypothetical protein
LAGCHGCIALAELIAGGDLLAGVESHSHASASADSDVDAPGESSAGARGESSAGARGESSADQHPRPIGRCLADAGRDERTRANEFRRARLDRAAVPVVRSCGRAVALIPG